MRSGNSKLRKLRIFIIKHINHPLSGVLWRWAPFHKSTRRGLCSAMDVAQPYNPASILQPARSYRDRRCNGIGSGSSLYPYPYPSAQFQNQRNQPRQPIPALKTGSSFSSELCSLVHDVFFRETLPQRFASSLNKLGVRKSADQANSEPVSVDGRMPVIAAIKGGVNLRGGAASASLFKVWLM